MLVTPRTYQLAQVRNRRSPSAAKYSSIFPRFSDWSVEPADYKRAAEMLLIHQVGSVRVGEVVRYTLTYTPSADRILPTPTELHVKVRNTSAIPLRAAYLRGPYTLYTACYPTTFNPNRKHDEKADGGLPQYEPNLKAGGSWDAVIPVPENIHSAPLASGISSGQSITWIIEVVSQVIFSSSASVHFEVLVARDEKSLELGVAGSSGLPPPGHVRDHLKRVLKGPPKGVYSDAVKLVVDDTESLWSTPRFPSFDKEEGRRKSHDQQTGKLVGVKGDHDEPRGGPCEDGTTRKKKIHLVIVTHGLHSNLGADMLYVKESIDAAAKQKVEDKRRSRARSREGQNTQSPLPRDTYNPVDARTSSPSSRVEDSHRPNRECGSEIDDDDADEQVIVRGFPGNAARTERGIQYLGKRLARYVLHMTYPDQPCRPVKTPRKPFTRTFTGNKGSIEDPGNASHAGSTIHRQDSETKDYAYQITSISFVGHSLGGLVQTYAIAYIQKHSPEFFERIKPINFVTLASPLLGLSNENPVYVRFALEFGLVGRTGQDLGLAWSAPSKVRNGWGAMIGGLGSDNQNSQQHQDPGSKPLLRILPTGPAHQVLKKFRNRTVYSNVVNDGIVPLRTSCLLFLDWKGLDRVQKARRENGLVGTMAEWGWAEITGANSTSHRSPRPAAQSPDGRTNEDDRLDGKSKSTDILKSPEPAHLQTQKISSKDAGEGHPHDSSELPEQSQFLVRPNNPESQASSVSKSTESPRPTSSSSPFNSFFAMFRTQRKWTQESKRAKVYKRSQTLRVAPSGDPVDAQGTSDSPDTPRARSPQDNSAPENDELFAPPRTSILESASDLLNPPLPPTEFLLDPSSRPRTIFHDRVYHPKDIPPPQPPKSRTFFGNHSSPRLGNDNSSGKQPIPENSAAPAPGSRSGMKVEEKIARAYHRDIPWRKVLVLLEPDAHNNIIVRRMFSNAYGWPVIKHLADTHFGYTSTAETADEFEEGIDRAMPVDAPASEHGEEVIGQHDAPALDSDHLATKEQGDGGTDRGTRDDDREPSSAATPTNKAATGAHRTDKADNLDGPSASLSRSSSFSRLSLQDSAQWTDRYFDDDKDYDSNNDEQYYGGRSRDLGIADSSHAGVVKAQNPGSSPTTPKGTPEGEVQDFLFGSKPPDQVQ